MKKTFTFVLITALTALFMMLTACGTQKTTESKTEEAKAEIALIMPSLDHNWMTAVKYYADKTAGELNVKFTLYTAETTEEQEKQIDEAIKAKYKAIILLPQGDVSRLAQKVLDAKIPLINFDRYIGLEADYFVHGDHKAVGSDSAKFIAEQLGESGNLIVLQIPSAVGVNDLRMKAFTDEIRKYPQLNTLETIDLAGYTTAEGKRAMAEVLAKYDNIDAVYAQDDEIALGALEVLKDTNIKIVVGGAGEKNFYKLMKNTPDMVLGSASYSPSMVSECMNIASDIVKGNAVNKEKDIIVPSIFVTKDNVDSYYDEKSPF